MEKSVVIRLSKTALEEIEKYRKKCIKNCIRYRDLNEKNTPAYVNWQMAARDWETFSVKEIVEKIIYYQTEED